MSFIIDSGDQDIIFNHIPLDREGSLLLSKRVNKTQAMIGDIVQYTLMADNQESFAQNFISIVDDLPHGFNYIAATATAVSAGTDGLFNTADDITTIPTVTGTDPITYSMFNIAAGEKLEIRYLVRISTGVIQGDYINTAVAQNDAGEAVSNTAQATVQIVQDPLLEKTTVIGTVFHDRDADGYQDNADATGVTVKSDYFGEDNHVIGAITGRLRETDPIAEHQVEVRMPYDRMGSNSFQVTTAEGTVIEIANDGAMTENHKGKKGRGMSGQDIRVTTERVIDGVTVEDGQIIAPAAAGTEELLITISNHGIHEEGIPGVRLATVGGLLIETDQHGRYHITDVDTGRFDRGTNYIVKVDPATLPEGATFTTENPRVVRLSQALMTKFNFGIGLPAQAMQAETVKAECKASTETYTDMQESVQTKTLTGLIEPVRFASGKSQIPAGYAQKLRAVIADLGDKQNLRLRFVGHTDNERLSARTAEKYGDNQGLSDARAKMVAGVLSRNLGLDSSQIETEGRGDTQPLASNATRAGMAQNRRVEVEVLFDEVTKTPVEKTRASNDCVKTEIDTVTETVTKSIKDAVEPVRFVSGKSQIPAGYVAQLRRIMNVHKDKNNLRFKFIGHTDNERLSALTASKYGSNQGLSESRAEIVAGVIAQGLGLQPQQILTEGYGDRRPVASNSTPQGMAANRRVEIEVLYDEAVNKQIETRKQVQVKKADKQLSLPHGGVIWATEDPAQIDPRLSITASGPIVIDGGKPQSPISFRLYSNYAAYIDRYEIAVYAEHDKDLVRPLSRLVGKEIRYSDTIEWDGYLQNGSSPKAGEHLQVILSVWDKEGRKDQTSAQLVRVTERDLYSKELEANKGKDSHEQYGLSQLVRQTIPLHGSRVRISGSDIDSSYPLTINGESIIIGANNRFVWEQQLPNGEHQFDIEVTDKEGKAWNRDLSVTIDGDYLFIVGLANLTVGENTVSGNITTLSADDHYNGEVYVDGRLALYLKGKIKGKYLITAQLDTTEDEIDNLGDQLKSKRPQSVFRRLDPDQYYPVYGDDSTTISDVDTQGAFYVRVDWNHNKAMWGNYNTAFTGNELAQYNRSLYGAQFIHKSLSITERGDHRTEVHVFGSEAQTASAHNEFAATGGSLYYLRETDIVRGSDKVWVEVRERDTDRTVENIVMEEGRDYQIDYIQGRIILNRPLSQVTGQNIPSIINDRPLEGNNVVLNVDYEYIPAGFSADDISAGLRGKGWLTEAIAIGATYVTEQRDSAADYQLAGVDLTLKLGQGSYLKGEYAESEASLSDGWTSSNGGLSFNNIQNPGNTATEGTAYSVTAQLNIADITDSDIDARITAWAKDREAGFASTRVNDGEATIDTGIEAQWHGDRVSLTARANQLEQGTTTRTTANLMGRVKVTDKLRLLAEVRNEDVDNTDSTLGFTAAGDATLGAVGIEYDISPQTEIYGSVQSVIEESGSYAENDAATLGIKSQVNDKLAIKAEASSGDRGDALILGVDYNIRENVNLQLEAGFGDNARSSIGSTWTTAGGTELYGSYAVDNDRTDNEQQTLTLGQRKQYGDATRVFAEQQFTNDKRNSGIAHIFGIDHSINSQLSLNLSLQHSVLESIDIATADTERDAATVGLSYTDTNKKASTRLEYRRDQGSENTTQYLSTNALNWKHNEHLRTLIRLNLALTENDDTSLADGKFIEADLGIAYRPAFSDRLNLLGKYSYLYDLPAQLSTGSLVGQNDSSTDERAHILSIEALYDISRKWELGAKLAARSGQTRAARDTGVWYDSGARLAAIRARYHFINQWDGLIQYQVLQAETGDDQRAGALIGVYKHVGKHFKVGVGYNFTDFTDDLSSINDYEADGWFIDLTGKF